MPLGKYYCDYCEKQFQDTPSARRRHLEGTQHQRAKALWYASVRSSSDGAGAGAVGVGGPLAPRGVCHHFVRTGFCQFGDGCRYFHPKLNVTGEHRVAPGPDSAVTARAPSSMGTQFIGGSVLGTAVGRWELTSEGN